MCYITSITSCASYLMPGILENLQLCASTPGYEPDYDVAQALNAQNELCHSVALAILSGMIALVAPESRAKMFFVLACGTTAATTLYSLYNLYDLYDIVDPTCLGRFY